MMCCKLADEINICPQCNPLSPVLSASPYTIQFLVYTSIHHAGPHSSLHHTEVGVCAHTLSLLRGICVFAVRHEAPRDVR